MAILKRTRVWDLPEEREKKKIIVYGTANDRPWIRVQLRVAILLNTGVIIYLMMRLSLTQL